MDLRSIPQALPLLRANAEKTKRRLSYSETAELYIPSIVQKANETIDLNFKLTREQLKDSTKDLIQRTFGICDEALREAGLRTSDIDAIILVGGPTKMPLILEAVEGYFGKTPLNDLNPDEVVSIGASIHASSLRAESTENKTLLLDVTPLDLGVATVDGFVETLVERNSPVPTSATKIFTTTVNNQSKVDIRIFQGKNRREEDSQLLGEFSLSGFPQKPAGEVSVEVSFHLTTDGMVQVSAVEKATGAEQSIEVKLSSSLGSQKVQEATEQSKEYQEVRLKDPWRGVQKAVVCLHDSPNKKPQYLEGYLKEFRPELPEIVLYNEQGAEQLIAQDKIAWMCHVNDFANIPRYLQVLGEKPSADLEHAEKPLYEFQLFDGNSLYGQTEAPRQDEVGIWFQPFFGKDKAEGKVFIYKSKVKSSSPLKVA